MIIEINKNNEVISSSENIIQPNGETCFEVDHIPKEEKGKKLYFDPATRVFYQKSLPQIPESVKKARIERARAQAEARVSKEKALKWLSDNDWKINKVVIGEWTVEDPRWSEYLAGRAQARLAIDEADEILNS